MELNDPHAVLDFCAAHVRCSLEGPRCQKVWKALAKASKKSQSCSVQSSFQCPSVLHSFLGRWNSRPYNT